MKKVKIQIDHCEECPHCDDKVPFKNGVGLQCKLTKKFLTQQEWEVEEGFPTWCPLEDDIESGISIASYE